MKKRILWIDDDMLFYKSWLAEAEEVYDVFVTRTVDDGWNWIVASKHTPDTTLSGIVLDILLPHGDFISHEQSNGGLRTGLAFIEKLKLTVEFKHIPIVIFTIRDSGDVDDVGTKYHIPVLRKHSTDLSEFMATLEKEFGK